MRTSDTSDLTTEQKNAAIEKLESDLSCLNDSLGGSLFRIDRRVLKIEHCVRYLNNSLSQKPLWWEQELLKAGYLFRLYYFLS